MWQKKHYKTIHINALDNKQIVKKKIKIFNPKYKNDVKKRNTH